MLILLATCISKSIKKYMKMRHLQIEVQKYGDGRWGWDDYSSGKRRMIRLKTKEKAEKRAAGITIGLTNSQGELLPINADELAEFREWKAAR